MSGPQSAIPPRTTPKKTPWPGARIIVFAGRSGGACKTTHSTIIAAMLAMLGYRVLYIDLDGQCNGSKIFGYPFNKYKGLSALELVQSATPLRPEGLKVTLAQTIKPALRRDMDKPGYPQVEIPNLWIVPASTELKETDRILTVFEDGITWFEDVVAEQLDELDVDVVLVDLQASEGKTVVSAMMGAVEVIGCMAPEGKYFDGIVQAEETIEKVRQSNPDSPLDLTAVVIGNYENANTNSVQIKVNRDYAQKARARWGTKVTHIARKSKARMPETYDWMTVLPYYEPADKVLDDYRIIISQLGFPPLNAAIPEQAQAFHDALKAVGTGS